MKHSKILLCTLMVLGIGTMLVIASCGDTGTSPEALTSLEYSGSPVHVRVGTEVTDIVPTLEPDGATAEYTIDPALPTGLRFNASSGVISGTPQAESPSTQYTVTAKGRGDYGGEVSGDITIEVSPLVSVTVSEISKKADTDVRDSYVLFSIESTGSLTDYHLAVKEAALDAPTSAEMTAGALKRNISGTAINVLIAQRLNAPMVTFAKVYFADNSQTTLGAGMRGDLLSDDRGLIDDDQAIGADRWITESVLTPDTNYKLYGMENAGSSIEVLMNFTTDLMAQPNYVQDNLMKTIDSTLANGHLTITVNEGEYYIFPVQCQFAASDTIELYTPRYRMTETELFTADINPDTRDFFGTPDTDFRNFLVLLGDISLNQNKLYYSSYFLMDTAKILTQINAIDPSDKDWNYGFGVAITKRPPPERQYLSDLVVQ